MPDRVALQGSVFLKPRTSASADAAESGVPAFDYVGTYTISGLRTDGTPYTVTATVRKIGGNMYSTVVTIGDNSFTGPALVDLGGALCVGWAQLAKDANVIVYDVLADGTLDGVWFGSGDTKLGRELWKAPPIGLSRTNGASVHAITGTNPDGTRYSGRAVATLLDTLSGDGATPAYSLHFTIGGSKQEGVAVALGNLVTGGFADSGKNFGALLLVPAPNTRQLSGIWVQDIDGSRSSGSERWTKQ